MPGSTSLTGGVHVKAALLLVALLGTGTILLTYLLARRLSGPIAGVVAALLAATYPAFIENNGRLLAEPVALFWLPAAMLAFLWASDGGRVVALAGAGSAARAHDAHPPGVPAVRGAVRAARARARDALPPAPPRRSAPGARRGAAARRRVLRRAGALDGAQRRRAGPLRAGHHRRRQGAVRGHLPARRRPSAARQAPADREVLRQDGHPLHARSSPPRWSRCWTASPRLPRAGDATPRWPGSGARTSASTRPSSRWTTPGW